MFPFVLSRDPAQHLGKSWGEDCSQIWGLTLLRSPQTSLRKAWRRGWLLLLSPHSFTPNFSRGFLHLLSQVSTTWPLWFLQQSLEAQTLLASSGAGPSMLCWPLPSGLCHLVSMPRLEGLP